MKLSKSCYVCLKGLVYQAAEMASDDNELRAKAIASGMDILEAHFSCNEVSIVVATKIHDMIKKITKNPDPYHRMKLAEIKTARELYYEIAAKYNNSLKELLKLAALGNTLDFFRPLDVIKREMKNDVHFVIDNTDQFEMKLKGAQSLLYLADNAGEVFFDLPLVKWLRQFMHVTYVVKASPVQNDITLADIEHSGLLEEIGDIITTGTATPGIIFSLASAQFKREFDIADLIFTKGMGYYESLSELPEAGKVFHCLKAKCQPVADSLGVQLNSFVAMLR
jgi:uncharacterized protein with ATP-grasp and redox domains